MFEKHKLLVPICLVSNDIFDSNIVIKVSNPQENELTLHKGTKVGSISNNIKDYDLVMANQDVEVKINSVQANLTFHDMKRALKNDHEELFKLYENSCEFKC